MGRKVRGCVLAAALLAATWAPAVEVRLSFSDTDPLAGGAVEPEVGSLIDLYVWIDPGEGQTINGAALNVVSSLPGSAKAVEFELFNPVVANESRWTRPFNGKLNAADPDWRGWSAGWQPSDTTLVNDSLGVAVFTPGINDSFTGTGLDPLETDGWFLHGALALEYLGGHTEISPAYNLHNPITARGHGAVDATFHSVTLTGAPPPVIEPTVAEPPVVEPPAPTPPPVDPTPIEPPPVDTTPIDEPVVDEPPIDEPPVIDQPDPFEGVVIWREPDDGFPVFPVRTWETLQPPVTTLEGVLAQLDLGAEPAVLPGPLSPYLLEWGGVDATLHAWDSNDIGVNGVAVAGLRGAIGEALAYSSAWSPAVTTSPDSRYQIAVQSAYGPTASSDHVPEPTAAALFALGTTAIAARRVRRGGMK